MPGTPDPSLPPSQTASPPARASGTAPPADARPSEAVAAALTAKGLEVREILGHGAHSIVYRARDDRLARDVAVKVIDVTRASRGALARFQREVSIVARLRHPHILPLYDAGIAADGSVFAVMPVASGQTLREYERRGPLPLRVVVALASEVADALAYAHDQDIVHRDIKPENILIEHGHAVVADFGLALEGLERVAGMPFPDWGEAETNERITVSGSFVGTPLYVSPEQIAGGGDADERSDIFSLAAVCYEMLTGQPPFRGATVEETLAARFQGPPPAMNTAGVRVPPGIETVVRRALSESPADRPPTVRAFREALIAAYRTATRPSGRRLAAAGLAVLVIGIGFGVLAQILGSDVRALRRLDVHRVAVADFDNETADSSYARWGDIVGDLVASRLASIPGVSVVTSERWLARRRGTSRESATLEGLRQVALETHAATVVSGGYYLDGGRMELIVEVTDARSGVLRRTYGPVALSTVAPDSAVLALADRLAAGIDSTIGGGPGRPRR